VQVLDRNKKIAGTQHMEVLLPPGETKKDISISLPGYAGWDEFAPNLYTVRVQITGNKPGQKDATSTVFGMRAIDNHNSLLWINDRRLFLRGTLECNIFPLKGHPPMDKKGWLKLFTTAKAYGLNHLRFHSWCPPQAAFEVADSLGFYLQVELPLWGKSSGKDAKLDKFEEEEAFRISRDYGNHPSFCFWSMGNELEGDFGWLAKMVNTMRQADPRHLYTSTTFSFQQGHGKWPEPADDFYITQYTKKGWTRGQGIFNTYPPDFKTDYTKSIDSLPVPIIIHEMGQYSVYPNMAEINKYTGVLDPLNFKAVRNDLAAKKMLNLAPSFTQASGKFSAHLYKEEIERALRTKGMSGFELLDLHDFPGQGTALIGILDAFWDSKGLITPEEHRMYCSPIVPLIRFDKAVYTSNETFTATAEVANFGKGPLKNSVLVWTATNEAGSRIAGGRLKPTDIAEGNGQELGSFSFGLKSIQKAATITIELQLQGTPYKNKWRIWVYPEKQTGETTGIVFTNSLSEALQQLGQGKKVLLNPDTAAIKGVAGRFAPVFWSPVHFPNQPGTMGILCNPRHPALKHFPTNFYSDWQWWDIITSSKAMILDSLPGMTPVVTVIDNFFKNRRMAEVIEAKVGSGRLLLVSADITHALEKRPAARQLRYSLEQYMKSDTFKPVVELNAGQLNKLAGNK
ncbi:MAG TPA: glycoside hydrolase family 2 TIM barrel-domain containing protein, partial [Chitinophagaceae bacterium]|nr:glycoside hydrolase family 2 TIM barrel-domain containing protein [Chitinophagaceae bacterium]